MLHTGQLTDANCEIVLNHEKTKLYLYIKLKPNPNHKFLIEESISNHVHSDYLLQIINKTFKQVDWSAS